MINIKQKLSINKSKLKTVVISIFNDFKKEEWLILILKIRLFTFIIKKIKVLIIDADTYCAACKLKIAQVFIISIKNLEY